jgi:hypothetical protein
MRARFAAVVILSGCLVLTIAPAASAHEGEENVPAFTDVQEGIAILASHPGSFPEAEVMDHAMDKVHDALESNDTNGVDTALVKQASAALDRNDMLGALVLLERSIGACPGAPVLEPKEPPHTPEPLSSPCPNPQHLQGLARSAVGGTQEAIFLVLAGVMLVAGLVLVRKIR